LDLKLQNRLITTFDEVPPYSLNAIHIANNAISIKRSWCNLCKRVPPKSFVQPRYTKIEIFMTSRLARTPPSTFLFLHLHLSNSPGSENPSPIAGSFPLLEVATPQGGLARPQSTANNNRWLSAVNSLILVRSQRRENLPWPRAEAAPRSVGRFIGLPDRPCQRHLSTNRRIPARILHGE